jgi:indolepyruvate ferredoxin oxidoreductase, alpha subunit
LLDPRPDLQCMVDTVEHGFALSEASNMPAILELRIRACHVRGSFAARDNRAPKISTRALMEEPAAFNYERLAHPPVTFRHEKLKIEQRLPAARAYIREHQLNELFAGQAQRPGHRGAGRPVQHAHPHAAAIRPGRCLWPDRHPAAGAQRHLSRWCPEELTEFCVGKRAVLMVEEGQPEYIEQELATMLRRADIQTPLARQGHARRRRRILGRSHGQRPGEVSAAIPQRAAKPATVPEWLAGNRERRAAIAKDLGQPLPARPPGMCIGCPERPVFSALKIAQQQVGDVHIAGDIGCHALATFEPFSFGHSILGYGMSLASRAGVSPMMNRRVLVRHG